MTKLDHSSVAPFRSQFSFLCFSKGSKSKSASDLRTTGSAPRPTPPIAGVPRTKRITRTPSKRNKGSPSTIKPARRRPGIGRELCPPSSPVPRQQCRGALRAAAWCGSTTWTFRAWTSRAASTIRSAVRSVRGAATTTTTCPPPPQDQPEPLSNSTSERNRGRNGVKVRCNDLQWKNVLTLELWLFSGPPVWLVVKALVNDWPPNTWNQWRSRAPPRNTACEEISEVGFKFKSSCEKWTRSRFLHPPCQYVFPQLVSFGHRSKRFWNGWKKIKSFRSECLKITLLRRVSINLWDKWPKCFSEKKTVFTAASKFGPPSPLLSRLRPSCYYASSPPAITPPSLMTRSHTRANIR